MLKRAPILLLICFSIAASAQQVPAWLLRVPGTIETIFIAETEVSSFHRFHREDDYHFAPAGQDYMSIGRGGIRKEREGDRKTPLGIYFVTEQLDTTRLHDKYGITAFPLDYPNAWDRHVGRTGDGIWVHGVDPNGGKRPPLDTDGCIALPNERLRALETLFVPNATPVLVSSRLEWAEPADVEAVRVSLEAAVMNWGRALEEGDLHAWLDAYDETFRHWGMSKAEWSSFSMQTIARRAINDVRISELLLLGDPAEDGLYLSRFRLEVTEDGARRVVSVRRMYWRRSESGAFRIIAEDSG
ncbi:MAG: L,D-transpeptidase family protein [Woeseiaceae bacterium]|nr:L,D-transpeptidase family protein [Woeseiaceae bacterium]